MACQHSTYLQESERMAGVADWYEVHINASRATVTLAQRLLQVAALLQLAHHLPKVLGRALCKRGGNAGHWWAQQTG